MDRSHFNTLPLWFSTQWKDKKKIKKIGNKFLTCWYFSWRQNINLKTIIGFPHCFNRYCFGFFGTFHLFRKKPPGEKSWVVFVTALQVIYRCRIGSIGGHLISKHPTVSGKIQYYLGEDVMQTKFFMNVSSH